MCILFRPKPQSRIDYDHKPSHSRGGWQACRPWLRSGSRRHGPRARRISAGGTLLTGQSGCQMNGATVLQDRRSKLVENQSMMSSTSDQCWWSVGGTACRWRICAPRANGWAGRSRTCPPHCASACRISRRSRKGASTCCPATPTRSASCAPMPAPSAWIPDEIARRFKAEASEVNRRTELVFPAPMPQRGVPAGAVILLGVVLAIGAYAGWYRLSGEGRLPAETVAPVPERLATLAEQAVPPPRPGRAAGAGRGRGGASSRRRPGAGPGRAAGSVHIPKFGGRRGNATAAGDRSRRRRSRMRRRPTSRGSWCRPPRMPGSRCATATAACC